MADDFDMCLHCKHLKRKYIGNRLVSDYCGKPVRSVHNLVQCDYFCRSWKSRLGLVKE